jgi:hypothetical protein
MIVGAKGLLLQGGGVVTLSDNVNNRIHSNTADAASRMAA